jgi:hypothetical protein
MSPAAFLRGTAPAARLPIAPRWDLHRNVGAPPGHGRSDRGSHLCAVYRAEGEGAAKSGVPLYPGHRRALAAPAAALCDDLLRSEEPSRLRYHAGQERRRPAGLPRRVARSRQGPRRLHRSVSLVSGPHPALVPSCHDRGGPLPRRARRHAASAGDRTPSLPAARLEAILAKPATHARRPPRSRAAPAARRRLPPAAGTRTHI